VRLTDETEPAMKTMRAIAADVRRDALAGLSVEERERFVDTLLMIKANLASVDNGPSGSGVARNGAVRNGARARRRAA
jgi:hypothetical protein